jgi:hypothetical protein
MRRLSLRAGPARRSSPTTLRTPTHVSGYYSDSSYEFDFRSDPDEPESETFTTEQPLSGPATGLVITSTPAGRFVYWPDRKPADLTDGNSRYVVYLDSLPFQEGTPLGLKVVELGRDNPNIIFTFTFEYENEIEFGKVGNENENELAGYQQIRK